jgi:hypothetical protein
MSRLFIHLALLGFFGLTACNQQALVLPETAQEGACGATYSPGREAGDTESDHYAVAEGSTFPCLVFESVRLNGEDTYLNFADLYLKAKHRLTDRTVAVIIIGAEHCPSCEVLINDLFSRRDDFDNAGVLMIGAVYCDNIDRADCDFDLDRSVEVAEVDGWPTDRWFVTNDAEGHLRPFFQESFPVAIAVRLSDMRVLRVDKTPTIDELFETVETLE